MRSAQPIWALLLASCYGCSESAACLFAGQRYSPGEHVSAADGCNTCNCDDDGRIACTEKACPSAIRDADAGKEVCLPGNPSCSADRGCRNGDELIAFGDFYYDADGCRSCQCVARGFPVRGGFTCWPSYCESEWPQCAREACAACTLGERKFELGSILPCPDGCNICACAGEDDWTQTLAECPALDRLAACTDPAPDPALETTEVSILFLSVDDASLALRVAYAGGCIEHRFGACFEPAFLESSPPVVRVRVTEQTDAEDPCDVPLRAELVYDLSSVREQFSAQYASDHGEVALRTSDDSIRYAF